MLLKKEILKVVQNANNEEAFKAALLELKEECNRLDPGTIDKIKNEGGAPLDRYIEAGRSGLRLIGEVIDLIKKIKGSPPIDFTKP
jgi:hypothetical protein